MAACKHCGAYAVWDMDKERWVFVQPAPDCLCEVEKRAEEADESHR